MKPEEINEGKGIVAKFMGAKHYPKYKWWKFSKWSDCYVFEQNSHIGFSNRHLKYDTSWDWLMPVWNKFRKLSFSGEYISADYSRHRYFTFIISSKITNCDIEAAFKELVEAIKWYNLNQQKA